MTRAVRSSKAQIETEHTHYVGKIPVQIPSGEEWENEWRSDDENTFKMKNAGTTISLQGRN